MTCGGSVLVWCFIPFHNKKNFKPGKIEKVLVILKQGPKKNKVRGNVIENIDQKPFYRSKTCPFIHILRFFLSGLPW